MLSLHCYASLYLSCLLNNASPYVKYELKKYKMQKKKIYRCFMSVGYSTVLP